MELFFYTNYFILNIIDIHSCTGFMLAKKGSVRDRGSNMKTKLWSLKKFCLFIYLTL